MRITVIGTGYVGLVTGACFSATGNHVTCVDNDESKIQKLLDGEIPIYEPGLERIVNEGTVGKRLFFTTDFDAAVRSGEIIFIAVGTPPGEDGSADLSAVETVAKRIGEVMNEYKVIVNKSTVPVGTAARITEIVSAETEHRFAVVSNPEFLKEGAAINDFMKPDRVVIGTDNEEAIELMRDLYHPFMHRSDRLLVMDAPSAEMTKYASNSMLATRISFMNEVAGLCDKVGANIEMVRRGMASDRRIGGHFLFPGVGFGGSCFPKDLSALRHTGKQNEMSMTILDAVSAVNDRQKHVLVEKVTQHFNGDLAGKVFTLWGLAFKPGTDDVREAPSITIAQDLIEAGATVRATDPVSIETAKRELNDSIEYFTDEYAALDGSDGLLLLTEWNHYRSPDFDRIHSSLRTRVIFDGRNIWDRKSLEKKGFRYYDIGV